MKRLGSVIGIKPDKIEEYKALHRGPGVRDLLRQANLRNFSIYITQLEDGRWYEFMYYEHVGEDYAADMAWLAAQPRNQAWLAVCDAMQIPLQGKTSWSTMEAVFFNE